MAVLGVQDVSDMSYVVFTDEVTGEELDTREWGFFVAPIMSIPDAVARTVVQEVPGMDGVLDLTEALGGVRFENRELEFQLIYDNNNESTFHYMASQVRNALDGRRMRVLFSEDVGWYWTGRCQVGTEKVGRRLMSLGVTVDAYPFKQSVASSYEMWKWDPFSFRDGVITRQQDVELNGGTATVDLPKDPSGSKVTLWLNSGTSVRARMSTETSWHTLRSGKNTFAEIRMSADRETQIVLSGTGSVGVDYRVGSL